MTTMLVKMEGKVGLLNSKSETHHKERMESFSARSIIEEFDRDLLKDD
jgi:hypothetical protein